MSLSAAVRPREPLTVREWDVLRPEQVGDRRAFEELHAWALGDEGRKVLEAGLGKIRVLNYVGILMTRSGFVLEILPKTEEGRLAQESRELLLHMLGRSGLVPSLGGQSAPAQTARLPLSEELVNLFLESVVALVKRGLSSSYEAMEADLPCVRGRIGFNTWAGRGIPKDRIPCGFDYLSSNSRENRILATALRICGDAGLGGGKVQRTRFLEDAFEEIESFPSPATALQALRGLGVDRKYHAYRDSLNLAYLILSGLNVAGSWAKSIRFSLFFPMELVFERFVHRGLLDMKARGELASVSYQSNRYFLLDRTEEGGISKSFNLRPDFVARTIEGKLWILDAKWKLLDERTLDGKNGISQSDLYQLLSYATIYRGELADVDRLILVYPEWSGFSEPIRYEYADSPRTPLHVIAAPLDRGQEWSLVASL